MGGNTNNNTKQAFWLGLGSSMSFGFVIISSMILSRYFNKEDYGTYKQVMYIYSTLLTIFTLGLPNAFSYFLPRVSLQKGKDLVNRITNLFYLLGALFSALLFLSAPLIAKIMNNINLIEALRIFSPVPFFMLPTMGLESIYATYRKTHISAIYTILTKVFLLVCVALPVFFLDVDYKKALYGFLLASLFNFLLALYLKNKPFKGIKSESCKIQYKEIFSFSLPLMIASLWGVGINSLDQVFISRYYGVEEFAIFSNGAMELPFIGMIVGACSLVLSPIYSKLSSDKDDIKTDEMLLLWKNSMLKSVMFIYPILLLSIYYAEPIMTILYGEQYVKSSGYFQIKSIANFVKVVSFAPFIISIGHTKFYSKVFMYGFFILLFLEYIYVKIFDYPYGIVIIHVVFTISFVAIFVKFIAKYLNVRIIDLFPLKRMFKLLFIVSISILITEMFFYMLKLETFELLLLIYKLFLFSIVYIVLSSFFRINYIEIIKSLKN